MPPSPRRRLPCNGTILQDGKTPRYLGGVERWRVSRDPERLGAHLLLDALRNLLMVHPLGNAILGNLRVGGVLWVHLLEYLIAALLRRNRGLTKLLDSTLESWCNTSWLGRAAVVCDQ